jgi:dTDP-4-amino-4,6-dideoxygalactose transaminase
MYICKKETMPMRPIQMVDLVTQYRRVQDQIDKAVLGVICSGKYINGDAVQIFSTELSEYLCVKHVIPCANGTDALQIALMALNLQPGDEVIVPAFTFVASAEVIALLKLTPVLVDVHPRTFNLDIGKIEAAISPRTKAILPVHLFGQTADMEPLMQIATKYDLHIVEDNAQSIGSVYTFSDGTYKHAGTMGDIGTLSFFPTKNLGGYGDGGALLTNDDLLARKIRMIASHGQSQKYIHEVIGCNSRLDTLQAVMLNVKLSYLDSYVRKRKKTAEKYNTDLESQLNWLETPYCIPASSHVYHQYTLKIKHGKRDDLQKYLKTKGIPTMVYYPLPLHCQPAFKNIVKIGGDLSESEKLAQSVLSLPMHTELDNEQIQHIISQIVGYE